MAILFHATLASAQSTLKLESNFSAAEKLIRNKEYSSAVPLLIKAIKIDSTGDCGTRAVGAAYVQLATAYYFSGDTANAKVNLDKAINLNPRDPFTRWKRAVLFSAQGKNEAAYSDLQVLLELSPEWTDAYIQRGLLYCYEGKLDLARQDLTKGIELDAQQGRVPSEAIDKAKRILRKIRKKS